jgi:hypothetical protein
MLTFSAECHSLGCVLIPVERLLKSARSPEHQSVRMKKFEKAPTNFNEILLWGVLLKFVDTLQFWFKLEKNNRFLHEDLHGFLRT